MTSKPKERKDNGGAAFPFAANDVSNMKMQSQGMTLRDWFAGQVLAGISSISIDGFSVSPKDEAEWAYQRADAMIAARAALSHKEAEK
jgi:hypothetical protein|tara:strand:- start:5560 stop:5823 length:264 start_codon:yes stop_codon:yes gene_type:complete